MRELASGPIAKRAAEVDRTEEYPWDNVELLKDARLIGMTIPTRYGGQARSWLDAVLVIEALSSACAVTMQPGRDGRWPNTRGAPSTCWQGCCRAPDL